MRKLFVFLFAVLLAATAHAAPKDWSDNEWYQYFEAAVTTLAGEAPGKFAKQAGTVAVTPVTDVYAALGATGSAVKPGLTLWLQRKMEEATLADDTARADRYQAFYTALATGDDSRLKALLQEYDRLRRQQAAGADGSEGGEAGAQFPPVGQLAKHPFNGVWKATWGELTLTVSNGGAVSGGYSYKTKSGKAVRGTLTGKLVGDYVIQISRWTESIPGEFAAGTGTMTITRDGKHFEGDYQTTEGKTGSGEWSGDKIR